MALFLLLEETGQHEFRRVGLCETHDGGTHERSKHFDPEGGFLRPEPPGRMLLEKLKASVKWQREVLRII
jgi:hypothetical protein